MKYTRVGDSLYRNDFWLPLSEAITVLNSYESNLSKSDELAASLRLKVKSLESRLMETEN